MVQKIDEFLKVPEAPRRGVQPSVHEEDQAKAPKSIPLRELSPRIPEIVHYRAQSPVRETRLQVPRRVHWGAPPSAREDSPTVPESVHANDQSPYPVAEDYLQASRSARRSVRTELGSVRDV